MPLMVVKESTRWSSCGSGKFDSACWQEIVHKRAASRHGRQMRGAGSLNTPAGGMTIESSVLSKWHNQIDLAVRMPIARSDNIIHMHDVERKTVRIRPRLEVRT
jgi:hypothetical protein